MKSNKILGFLFSKQGVITLFGVVLLSFVMFPLLSASDSLSALPYWFHDHFFNAVQIADNFRTQGFPSVDTITPTNDFSPVWTCLLAFFSMLTPIQSPVFFALVLLAIAFAGGLSLFLLDKLVAALQIKPPPAVRFFTYSLFLGMYMRQAITGMDTVWAIPVIFLMALAFLRMLEKPSFVSGLLCSLSILLGVLTRFDTLGFVISGAFIFYMQFNGKVPVTLKDVFKFLPGFLIGLIPLAGWLFYGYWTYGTPVPSTLLSWMKVQNIAPWKIFTVLFWQPLRYFLRMPTAFALMTFPATVIIMVAYASIPRDPKKTKPQTPKQTLFYSLLWFPIIQFLAYAFFTFMLLPEYAYYPLVVGTPIALLYGLEKIDERLETPKDRKEVQQLWQILAVMLLILSLFIVSRPRIASHRPIAETVRDFAQNNPGIYAMSSGAGITSYQSSMPVIRLDGLGADKKMLDLIAQQATLSEAFKHYGVDYYIVTNLIRSEKCFAAREPRENRLGASNKGMSDWLCADPVFTKEITPKTTLMIFAIDQNGKAFQKTEKTLDETKEETAVED